MASARLRLLACREPERLLRARNGSWAASDVRVVADRAFARRFGELGPVIDLSLLALAMSRSLPHTKRANDARARALAIYGNVLRMKGDLEEARLLLDQALLMWRKGTQGCALGAFVSELRASLWQAMSLWDLAAAELDQAEAYRRSRGLSCATLLIQRGLYLAHAGDPDRALRVLEQGLVEAHAPDLICAALANLAWVYAEAGRAADARNTMLLARPLFERATPAVKRSLTWIEARICDLQRAHAGAESLYRRARIEFLRAGRPQEAALCGLDLALLLARQGKMAETLELSYSGAHLLRLAGGRQEEAAARLLGATTAERVASDVASCLGALIPTRLAMCRGAAASTPATTRAN